MGVGAILEPLVVITLLVGGTYINRNSAYKLRFWQKGRTAYSKAATEGADVEYQPQSRSSLESGDSDDALLHGDRPDSPSLFAVDSASPWREREISLWTFRMTVRTPNSRQFKDRWFSRILRKYPFMQEAFYWALIYWVGGLLYHQIWRVLIFAAGIPDRSSHHGSSTRRIDRRHRTAPCTPSNPYRATARHVLGTANPAILPRSSIPSALDKPNLLFHPHTWHDPLSRRLVLPHHDTQPHI